MKKKMSQSWLGLLLMMVTSCANSYEKTVNFVERDRFMTDWYVQAGRFTRFEKDAYNAVEKYRWNEKEQRIDIDFSYNEGSLTGKVKKIPQTAWIVDEKTNAHWKVSPFWPLKFNYLIIALDENYEWTAIGVPDESYLWIMSKVPHLPHETITKILEDLNREGYNTDNIVYVEHNAK